jgi:hypothetical protein
MEAWWKPLSAQSFLCERFAGTRRSNTWRLRAAGCRSRRQVPRPRVQPMSEPQRSGRGCVTPDRMRVATARRLWDVLLPEAEQRRRPAGARASPSRPSRIFGGCEERLLLPRADVYRYRGRRSLGVDHGRVGRAADRHTHTDEVGDERVAQCVSRCRRRCRQRSREGALTKCGILGRLAECGGRAADRTAVADACSTLPIVLPARARIRARSLSALHLGQVPMLRPADLVGAGVVSVRFLATLCGQFRFSGCERAPEFSDGSDCVRRRSVEPAWR